MPMVFLLILSQLYANLYANTLPWVQVTLPENKTGWIRSTVLMTSLDFSSKAILKKKYSNIDPNTEVTILGSKDFQFKCKHLDKVFWVDHSYLAPVGEDLGYIVTTKLSGLSLTPSMDGKTNLEIKKGLKIKAYEFVDGFVKIKWEGRDYFVEFDNVLSRFNFASKVKTDKWHDVQSLLQDNIITSENNIIKVKEVSAITTSKKHAYIVTNFANVRAGQNSGSKLVTRLSGFMPISFSSVGSERLSFKPKPQKKILKIISHKTPKDRLVQDLYLNKKSWTSDELFNRKIFDIVTSKKNESLMFASANGVFRSDNGGKIWKKLEMFEDKNLPIAISKHGVVYIGQYKSDDEGRTFLPFVKWDLALKALQYQGLNQVGSLSIENISFLDEDEDSLKLDLKFKDQKKGSIITYDQGVTWLPVID